MKKWCFFLILLLLLTGCGKQEIPSVPYDLEVEYGDSGVLAAKGGYSWTAEGGSAEAEDVEPLEILSDIPFVNESKDKKINLLFAEKPDSLEISFRSSADGYKTLTAVEKPKTSFAAPSDGASYLYIVTAQWAEEENLGGSCTYWFRYLPAEATGEQAQEMSLYRLVQLEAKDLFGVEFHNNLDGQRKTCTSEADRTAILDYLKNHLVTNFVSIEMPEEEADYVLRLAVTQGEQLTLGYGGEGQGTWIQLGGVPYEAEVMDLYSLWESLEAESEPLYEEASREYLSISETAPLEGQEGTVQLGYLQSMDGNTLIYKEVEWVNDETAPNGYDLQEGDLRTLSIPEDCQYWQLDQQTGFWGQLTREQFEDWNETAEAPVLFHFHALEDTLLAVYEKFVP